MPATVFRHCAFSVFTLCKHSNGNSALVRLFFFFFPTVASINIKQICASIKKITTSMTLYRIEMVEKRHAAGPS